jgi:hypothetical protein
MDTERSNNEKKPSLKPDPETLHTTDPQKEMKGPVSSTMHGAEKVFDTKETKHEADEKRNRNL